MLRTSLLSGVAAFLLALIACSKDETPEAGASTSSTTSSSGGETSNGGSSNGSTSSSSSGGTSGNPPPPAPEVDVADRSVTVGGRERAFKLVVPKTYDANKAYPLIVALHGDGGNSSEFITSSGLDRAAGKEAVMAFPDQSVNIEYMSDDQKLIPLVVAAVKAERNIDAGKVWGYGYSKGAFQISELLCLPDAIFNAVAIHAGGAPSDKDEDGNNDCYDPHLVPMFVTAGSADPDIEGIRYSAQFFADLDGCDTGAPRTPVQPDICSKYNGCGSGRSFVLCEVPGQGHFPLYGDAAAHSWAWFKSLP